MSSERLSPKESVERKIAKLRTEITKGNAVTETFPILEMEFLLREIFAHHPEVNNALISCQAEGNKIRVRGSAKPGRPITTLPIIGDIRYGEVLFSTSNGEIKWKLEQVNNTWGPLLSPINRLVPKALIEHEIAIGQRMLLQARVNGNYVILPNGALRATFTPKVRR